MEGQMLVGSMIPDVNPGQARALLDAIEKHRPSGPLLMPFFAALYFAGLRPEEAVNLREKDMTLPDTPDTWGEFYLTTATRTPAGSGPIPAKSATSAA
ncbi:hypothetical protein [Streptosporangium roseum]|uniref:hypothetical protein n=1 Tax=Streptosporangium roseum TaxID=2001 RepID=UPI0033275598